jgi:ABC-type branched-subunit amino acid transport system permease subunit
MQRFGLALAYAIGGYVVAAVIGYFAIRQFSVNVHDRDLEAAMTGAFVAGPIGAVAAFVIGLLRKGRGDS